MNIFEKIESASVFYLDTQSASFWDVRHYLTFREQYSRDLERIYQLKFKFS